jgi:CRISPR-associated protein Csb2
MRRPRSVSSSRRPPRQHHAPSVTLWRWRIGAADAGIPLSWALALGCAVAESWTEAAWALCGSGRLPICLHGPKDPERKGWNHEHAFVLPEDGDDDGFIDHIAISADAGFDPAAIRILAASDRLRMSNGLRAELVLDRAGGPDCLPASVGGPAQHWVSSTPYVPDGPGRARYNSDDAARQLKHAIRKRRPNAVLAEHPEFLGRHALAGEEPGQFHLEMDNGATFDEASAPGFFRLTFAEPVSGPLAFGWGCHRGLGIFRPEASGLRASSYPGL